MLSYACRIVQGLAGMRKEGWFLLVGIQTGVCVCLRVFLMDEQKTCEGVKVGRKQQRRRRLCVSLLLRARILASSSFFKCLNNHLLLSNFPPPHTHTHLLCLPLLSFPCSCCCCCRSLAPGALLMCWKTKDNPKKRAFPVHIGPVGSD